jgi:signal transduction histidine kinase/streptogramin lyase
MWIGAIDGPLGERVLHGALAVADRADRFQPVALRGGGPMPGIMAIVEDADRQLWLGTAAAGVGRLRNGRIETRALAAPFKEFVYALVGDDEGNLWVGTEPHGLHRLQKSRVLTYTRADGLGDDVIESLLEDRTGAMLVGTHAGGLCRIDAGTRCLTTANGLAHNRVNAMLQDPQGTLWLGTEGGLDELRGGRVHHFSTRDGLPIDHVNALLRDRSGTLWVGTWGGGVARSHGDRFEAYDAALSGRYVNTIYQGRSDTIWIGTTDGLSVVDDGRMTNATTDRGMPQAVEAIHEDSDGHVWIGTRRDGLFLVSSGRLTRFTVAQGLYDNLVGTIVDDQLGNLWFTCNRGIFRVRRQDLLDVAAGAKRAVVSRAFDTTDGMANRECDFGQGSCRTRDGRLWFATVGGVVVVDPSAVSLNTVPPRVAVEEVTADGEPLPFDSRQTLDYRKQHLDFHFVGISLSAPERVRYRYRLEGFDEDWIDAGEARSTRYTNLPPGDYRFVVTASNGDGVWAAQGAFYAFAVATPIWRRGWFAVSLVGFAAAVLVGVAQLRVARLQRARARQEAFSRQLIAAQENERQRLAGDLHDGIGQHLLVIGNWARLAMRTPSSAADARAALEVITEAAATSMRDIRALTHELQPYELEHTGLPGAIQAMLDRLTEASGVRFVADLASLPVELPSEVAINVFRIAQEAANNVVKHARATEAHVALGFRDASIALTVSDNGDGFAVGAGRRRSGFGLRSIEERTRLLGGTQELQSVPGRGTTVTVRIPLRSSGGARVD